MNLIVVLSTRQKPPPYGHHFQYFAWKCTYFYHHSNQAYFLFSTFLQVTELPNLLPCHNTDFLSFSFQYHLSYSESSPRASLKPFILLTAHSRSFPLLPAIQPQSQCHTFEVFYGSTLVPSVYIYFS